MPRSPRRAASPIRRTRLLMSLDFFLSLLISGLITGLVLWCQPFDFAALAARFLEKPGLIILNFLPVVLLLWLSMFVFRNLFFAAALVNLILSVLSVANRLKIQLRDEPVFPRDLALLKEAGSAVSGYAIQIPWDIFIIIVSVSALFLLIGMRFPAFPERLRDTPKRAFGAVLCAASLWILTVTVMKSDRIYDYNTLDVSIQERLSVVFNENGFIYNFFHQFTKYQIDRPPGYSRTQAAAWDSAAPNYPAIGENKPVSVIFVMNEAFSDITDNPVFDFAPEDDPLSNLHAIQSDPHAISLRCVVPGFAGGTANTEFDICTGIQTNALSSSTTSAMRTVNRNLDSLFRIFHRDGYQTAFYHPGDNWFYNRENVYRWFGADETVFINQMDAPEYKGRWVTDDYFSGVIERAFDDASQADKPLFLYATTIQNHMSYYYNKYNDDYIYPPVSSRVPLSDAVREILEVYTEGIRDADAMLGRLRDDLVSRPEPVLLVFFGDHLPYLGDCYDALGITRDMEADVFAAYETPCVIWANDAAFDLLNWNPDTIKSDLGLPENGKLSAAFLGAMILELTGRGYIDSWTEFLNLLRRQCPVIQRNLYMLPDGTVFDENHPEAIQNLDAVMNNIRKWRQWSYYKLTRKEILN